MIKENCVGPLPLFYRQKRSGHKLPSDPRELLQWKLNAICTGSLSASSQTSIVPALLTAETVRDLRLECLLHVLVIFILNLYKTNTEECKIRNPILGLPTSQFRMWMKFLSFILFDTLRSPNLSVFVNALLSLMLIFSK